MHSVLVFWGRDHDVIYINGYLVHAGERLDSLGSLNLVRTLDGTFGLFYCRINDFWRKSEEEFVRLASEDSYEISDFLAKMSDAERASCKKHITRSET